MVKKTVSQKTKEQLFEENKILKEKLREYLKKEDEVKTNSELNDLGVSIIKEGEHFKLVELKFNRVTKEAQVTNIEDTAKNTRSYDLALQAGMKFLVTKIFDKIG